MASPHRKSRRKSRQRARQKSSRRRSRRGLPRRKSRRSLRRRPHRGGAWTDFIPFYGSKTDEIPAQLAKVLKLWSKGFGFSMSPYDDISNKVAMNVPLGALIMSHPVLGEGARPGVLKKTLERAQTVTDYLYNISQTDPNRYSQIKTGTLPFGYRDLPIFDSRDAEGDYDPIMGIPIWAASKDQKLMKKMWEKSGGSSEAFKMLLQSRSFKKYFGYCPSCDNCGLDEHGKQKCRNLKVTKDPRYLVLSGQGRVLALRMGVMNFNYLYPHWRIPLSDILVEIVVADATVEQATNFARLKRMYKDDGLYEDDHASHPFPDGFGADTLLMDGYQYVEAHRDLPMVVLSARKTPLVNDAEHWLKIPDLVPFQLQSRTASFDDDVTSQELL